MRIAVFTELYAPSIGGQEMFFQGLARALVARGHAIDVYTIAHRADLPPVEQADGITVHRFPADPSYTAPKIGALKRNWWTILAYARRTAAVARKGKHDFYLLNEWPLLHALMLPRAARRRALLHWCEIRQARPLRWAQRHLPRHVRLNAAISKSVGDQIHAVSGREVMTLPSGLDLSRTEYRAREGRRDIVMLGRVSEHKNVPLAIAAFEMVCARGYSGRLRIAGDGPDMPAVRERVAASPARDAIDLLGFIDDAVKFKLLAECELFAMPSRREGFPHVVSEAMCCGLPIVTADYPENGTKDVVRLYDVGTVAEPSAEGFAAAMEQTLASWDRYSDNGVTAAATLDWTTIAERLEQQIDRVVAGRG